ERARPNGRPKLRLARLQRRVPRQESTNLPSDPPDDVLPIVPVATCDDGRLQVGPLARREDPPRLAAPIDDGGAVRLDPVDPFHRNEVRARWPRRRRGAWGDLL